MINGLSLGTLILNMLFLIRYIKDIKEVKLRMTKFEWFMVIGICIAIALQLIGVIQGFIH